SAFQQFVQHVLITYEGSRQRNATFSQSQLQTEITHHCRNDSVAGKLSARAQVIGHDEQDLIAVHQIAAFVNHQQAVGVAIESQSEVGFLFDHGLLQFFGMQRATVQVDVSSVRVGIDHGEIGSERGK